ncbi:MAG: DUF4158 domain-containing protein, partial [Fusobacteriaceae bacterium]|nr:DUF4158 domain-containing protein [Fusobacteriaceae bacterium]
MKKTFSHDELVDNFSLSIQEFKLLKNKAGATRLGFAVMLKFFQNELKFPDSKSEIPKAIIKFISEQIDVKYEDFNDYKWNSRSIKYHRKQIREFFDYKEISANDYNELKEWLYKYILPHEHKFECIIRESNQRFIDLKIELPAQLHLERVVASAINTFEDKLFKTTFNKIPKTTLEKIDNFIESMTNEDNEQDSKYGEISLTLLKSQPGRIGIKSLEKEIEKLKALDTLNLPDNIFENISKKVLYKYKQRTISEDVSHLR